MSSASIESRARGSLSDVLATDELIRRPARPPNFEAENAALHALARRMADGGDSLLDSLVHLAVELCCPGGTAGVSLLEQTTSGGDVFRWVALAGQLAAHVGGTTPRDFSPCGVCLDRNGPQLYAYPERFFTYFASARPIICEGLVIPFSVAGRQVGTIWVVSHDAAHRFDGEDVRVMTRLADFTAAAYRRRSEIVERKNTEAALRASEQELRDFVENATEPLHWVGPDGIILWANQAELDLVGYTRDEYIGHHIADFHADRELSEDILARLTGGESLRNYEARLRCKDGSVRYVLINSNVQSRDGKFIHTRCFTRDVTDLRRLADAVRQSEQRLRLAIRATHDVIYELDFQTGECRFDDSVREVMGHAHDTLPTSIDGALRFWSDHLHPDDRDRVMASYQAALQNVTTGRWAADYRLRGADGTYAWVAERAVIERDADGRGTRMVGALQDITDRKRGEQERQHLVAALEHTNRQKDAFLATVSHELRQPIAAIQAAVGLMRLGANREADEKARAVIERQVAQLARLVDDLLDAARIVRGKVSLKRQRTALNDIIDAAVTVVEPVARAREQELQIGVPPTPIWVDGDANRLQQVFSNLLSNAVKFTPRGGRIELVAELDVNLVIVRMRDTGCGIAADMLPRVFDLFAQGTANSGLGIGLAVVRGLVERHGGTVEVRSEGVGKGSEFVVRLPLAPGAVAAKR